MIRITLTLIVPIALIGAAPIADPFDRAADALTQGLNAESHADRATLRVASRALGASGAAPVEGQDDAVTRWVSLGHAAPLPAMRDRALGPGYRLVNLGAGASVAFEQTFLAGQRARVAVAATSTSAFALSVTGDTAATPACFTTSAHTRCDWVPTFTERFRIALANRGARASRFFLVVQ